MRLNDDGKTVAAMDVLAPGIGEIIGGSQREERLDVLDKRMEEMGLNPEDYWWYRDLRKYGTVPHSGFGLGFERLVVYVTGVQNQDRNLNVVQYHIYEDLDTTSNLQDLSPFLPYVYLIRLSVLHVENLQ